MKGGGACRSARTRRIKAVCLSVRTILPRSIPTKMLRFLALAAVCAVALCQQGGNQGPPPFLQGAAPAKVAEFQQLVGSSAGLTDDAVDKKVAGWIAQQDAGIQAGFKKFQAEIAASQAAGKAAHAAAIAGFSPEAKAADAALSKIADDRTLTVEAKGQKIDALIKSFPPAVRAEIEKAMQG